MNAHADWRLAAAALSVAPTADNGHGTRLGLHDRLPRLTEVAVNRTNRLLTRAPHACLVWAGANLTSHWCRWRASTKDLVHVRLVGGGEAVLIAYAEDDEPLSAEGFDWRNLQGDSGLVAWSLRHEALIVHLQDLLEVELHPERVVFGPAEAVESSGRSRLGLTLLDESGAEFFHMRVDLPSRLLPQTSELSGTRSGGHVDADLIYIPLRWELGTITVSLAEVELLDVGDVLCACSSKSVRGLSPLTMLLPSGVAKFDAVVAECVATVTRAIVPCRMRNRTSQSIEGGTNMSQVAEFENPTDLTWNADQLPVDLSFELGGVEMTVGDLRQLAPGYTFSLAQRLEDSPVLIRANGRAFGFGELVLVDDFLGVRVTRFATDGRE